ncbi:dual specificity protein phosphatase 8 isoform X2 [Stigmatopora argus]
MAGEKGPGKRGGMDIKRLAGLIQRGSARLLVIDSRTFSEFNAWHVQGALNVCCSKLVKRRLQQDKMAVTELLQPNCKIKVELGKKQEVVLYDQSSKDVAQLAKDGFVHILMSKLEGTFHKVSLLTGGFAAFSSCFPGLCEGKPPAALPVSLSQPCLPVANVGPTRILPHLYLGSQKDVLNKDLMFQNGITFVLNASNTCPKPDFINESHFMRIPVNDNYCEKLLPWLDKTNEFIDKAKVSNCRVIVHCLAGISRSATIAIAYIMKTMGLSSDDAYRFVKDRRPSISPNFNFLGQLLEFEKGLRLLRALTSDQLPEGLTEAEGNGARREGESSPAEPPNLNPEPQAPSPSSLRRGFNGLRLSADRMADTNRLKRSFSLDIKSAYSPAVAATTAPAYSQDLPKLCKLDSPGSQSPVSDSPGSCDSPGSEGVRRPAPSRSRRKGKQGPGVSPLPFRRHPPAPPPLRSPGGPPPEAPSLPVPGPGAAWTQRREGARAGTPGTPEADGGSPSPAYAAARLRDEAAREKPRREKRDFGAANDKQFKRRSCQMEFEEGISETRSREELGKIGKQSSFSGSLEIIEVS